jgi:neutral ceramidase
MPLRAGIAQVDISPRKPMFLVGYPHVPRTSAGIHDPLYATALCLRSGDASLMLIAVDILFVTHATARQCRDAIRRSTGVPESNILISATHTHSGPVTYSYLSTRNDPVMPLPDPAYMEFFTASLARAGIEAWRNATPARLAATTARAQGVGGNRRSRDGLADPEVGILYLVRDPNYQPLALSLTYSMHPTVLHEDSRLVSSDFPGYARQILTERLPGLTVCYHTGPAGDQSPRYHVKGQTFAEAERLGRKLGDCVHRAVAALKPGDFADNPVLRAMQSFVDLPVREFVSVAEAEGRLRAASEEYERLRRENAGHGPVRTAECTVFGAEELVALAQAQAMGEVEACRREQLPAEVQVLRIGDAFWVGLRGELFVEYGLEIKRRAPRPAFVISLANGELQGYIVTPEADAQGGYEAACSFFTPEAGRILSDKAVAMMEASLA